MHNEKYSGIFNRYYRESIVFYRMFPEQKFHLRDFMWLWLLNTSHDYVHALREKKLMRNILQIPLFRLMQFWGTYRGYVQRDPVTASLRRRFYYPGGLTQTIPVSHASHSPERDYIDYLKYNEGGKVEQPH